MLVSQTSLFQARKVIVGGTDDSYLESAAGLLQNTKYYFSAYATNRAGTDKLVYEWFDKSK